MLPENRAREAADAEGLWLAHRNGLCDDYDCEFCAEEAFAVLDEIADIPPSPARWSA